MLRVFDKPAGVTTHTSLSDEERKRKTIDPIDGFLEHLTYRSGQALWPVHRLDVETTGTLIATDSAEEAAELGKLFETRDVKKVYYFISDRQPRKTFKSGDRVETHITRMKATSGKGPQYVSFAPTSIEPINAVTTIELAKQSGAFSLWKATPETGKPHQIRLHAEGCGLSILGDSAHGGTHFPVMCLHASEIRFQLGDRAFEGGSAAPKWFSDLSLLESPRLVQWLAAVDRRERLGRSLATLGVLASDTARWIHTEGGDLRLDRLGHILQLGWYGASFTPVDKKLIQDFLKILGWPDWYLQIRGNRGKQPQSEEVIASSEELPLRWNASEESLRFTFRRDTGLSSGLFLDQRANRRWILQNTKDKSVLNLFSYTGGFSLAAARAGAKQVVSVDLSKGFLEWSKENFVANGIDPTAPGFEFRAIETRSYLDFAKKKGLKFDLVICDPPSFARLDSGVFRIETEFEKLLNDCLDVTAPGGTVLFSTNYELLKEAEVFTRAEAVARLRKPTVSIARTPSPDWDFEFPREPRAMKSLFATVSPS